MKENWIKFLLYLCRQIICEQVDFLKVHVDTKIILFLSYSYKRNWHFCNLHGQEKPKPF